jgi:hypothetical protein
MKTKLFISAIVLLITAALANAQEKDTDQALQNPPVRGVWVDADNNGICDNFEARAAYGFRNSGRAFMRAGRQGFYTGAAFRNPRPGYGYCRYFINPGNSDNISPENSGNINPGNSDNISPGYGGYGRYYTGPGNRGYGRYYTGPGNRGYGRYYIDANNNGICDYREIPE